MHLRPLLLGLLTACQPVEPTSGNGIAAERAWPLGEVTAVKVSGPVSVQVLVGPTFTPGLRVEGDSNVVAALRRSMEGRALILDASALSPSLPLNVIVTAPSVSALSASDRAVVTANALHGGRLVLEAQGSARLLVNGVDADSLVVSVARTSTVDAAGRARLLTVTAKDVGTAALGSLRAQVALVEATELSTVRVLAVDAVRGEASRSSRLDVLGAPTLRSLSADEGSFVQQPDALAPTAGSPQRAPGEG